MYILKPSKTILSRIIVALLIFVFSLLVFFYKLPSYDFVHRDEANWSRVSVFAFKSFFIDRDFSNPEWAKPLNRFGSYSPQIGKYILGVSQWLMGYREYDGIINWQTGKGMQWHIQQGIIPDQGRLYAARFPSAVLSALTATTIFLLILELPGRNTLIGIMGSVFYLLNHQIQLSSRQAMMDLPGTAFSVFTIFFLIQSMKTNHLTTRLGYSLITAFLAGVAISIKLTNLAILATIAAAYLVLMIADRYQSHSTHDQTITKKQITNIFILALSLLIPLVIFILSNPFLFEQPITGIKHMLSLNTIFASERAAYTEQALYTLTQRGLALITNSFGSEEPIYVYWIITGLGLIFLVKESVKTKSVASTIFWLWALTTVGGMLMGLHLARIRWYLNMAPILAIIMSFGLFQIIKILLSKLFNFQKPEASTNS